jgi:hypothetical protein
LSWFQSGMRPWLSSSPRPAPTTLKADVRTNVRSPTVYAEPCMSPFWLWTQALIIVFVLAGMVIAITKLV